MVWIGLVRPIAEYLLLAPCGPVWSKLSASEITLPFLTSLVAAMMSSGAVKLSVPISSLGPHLPQFLYFSAASRMSWRVILRADITFPLMKATSIKRAAGIQPAGACDASPPNIAPLATAARNATMPKNRGGIHGFDRKKSGGLRCAMRGDHRAGLGGRLSRQAGEGYRAVRARRTHRRDGAADCAEAVGKPEAAILRREPSRRRRQYRHAGGREIGARRLHHPGRQLELRGQSEPLCQKSLRPVQGFRADHSCRSLAEYPGG